MLKQYIRISMTVFVRIGIEVVEAKVVGPNEVNHKKTGKWDIDVSGRCISKFPAHLHATREHAEALV